MGRGETATLEPRPGRVRDWQPGGAAPDADPTPGLQVARETAPREGWGAGRGRGGGRAGAGAPPQATGSNTHSCVPGGGFGTKHVHPRSRGPLGWVSGPLPNAGARASVLHQRALGAGSRPRTPRGIVCLSRQDPLALPMWDSGLSADRRSLHSLCRVLGRGGGGEGRGARFDAVCLRAHHTAR